MQLMAERLAALLSELGFSVPVDIVKAAMFSAMAICGDYRAEVEATIEFVGKNLEDHNPKFVVIRNMVPAPDFPYSIQKAWASPNCAFEFTLEKPPERSVLDEKGPYCQEVMGDYYPVAVWCDKSTFIHGGWQACMERKGERR